MDVIEFLTRQHRSMEQLMADTLDTEDEQERRTRFTRVADGLAAHVASEEQIFYPAVRAERTEDILLESLEEHLSLKRVLADLLEMQPSQPTFEAKFHVLKEQAEHHHREEEEGLFPKVRRLLSDEQREALSERMQAFQREMQHDGAPRGTVRSQTDRAAPLRGEVQS